MREEIERPAAGPRARRSPFDHFVEAIYQRVSGPPFFLVCAAIGVAWLVSLPLWGDTKAWRVAIHTIASVITTARRSAEERRAAQRRGRAGEAHVIAEALAALMASRAIEDHTLEEAVTRLRDAVVLEERH